MNLIGRLAVVTVALATGLVGLIAAPAQASPDVYTTPGTHSVNGRLWNTRCAKYSSSVVRCTTDIQGTLVILDKGKFTTKTGWHFNNLTYLPSARSAWSNNPLGGYAKAQGTATWTSAGLKWRTECDTPATGRGACRSYIHTQYAAVENGKPVARVGWVFNNIVRFAEGSVRPVTAVPSEPLSEASVISFDGVGPVKLGMSVDQLRELNYFDGYGVTNRCGAFIRSAALDAHGIWVALDAGQTRVAAIYINNSALRTAEGARVGMTFGALETLYGEARVTYNSDDDSDVYLYRLRRGDNVIRFLTEFRFYLTNPVQQIAIGKIADLDPEDARACVR